MNDLFKYAYHKWFDRPSRWHPFLSVYYMTYRCDFRCPYCSNGFNKPYYELSPETPPGSVAIEILRRIRKTCEHVVLTGGEPLLHPDAHEIFASTGGMHFRSVALNTNGYLAGAYLDVIAENITELIFSMDTLDAAKADAWSGKGQGTFDVILANIEKAAAWPGRNFKIVISAVATPGNIDDLYEVYAYTRAHEFTFAVCPELQGVKATAPLQHDKNYRAFFDYLISEKKKGHSIFGSPLYLEHMRDLSRFTCHPFTMLVVDPTGTVFYPCLELGFPSGNILETADQHALRMSGLRQFGPQPECGTQCHSACALAFSLLLEHPSSALNEKLLNAKLMLK